MRVATGVNGGRGARMIPAGQARAAEIASELTQSFEFSPAERLAVQEAARCIAILEAIDRDLDQRGGAAKTLASARA